MWIESTISFEIQCITEGLQIDKAGLSTKIKSQLDETNDVYTKTGMTLDSIKHFMCTLLDEMELVRDVGQGS